MVRSLDVLNQAIRACRKCPRLVAFRESVPKRASFKNETYCRRPTPGFGDPKAQLLILGLAPSAHGGNRTGRIFTGDESARFLMNGLFKTGFANQPISRSMDDGLKLKGCYITASVKCVPPHNKPLRIECENCFPYLEEEFHLLSNLKYVLALGQLAYQEFFRLLKKEGCQEKAPSFKHGLKLKYGNITLLTSYHPSPQNTYTKKLTEKMFINVLNQIELDC